MRPPRGEATISRSRVAIVALVVALLAGGALAAGLLVGGSTASDKPTAWPTLAQSSSFVTAAGSWAIVPMGDLSDPANTFWQIFFRATGTSKWSLVTPPGVAANGGLVATVGAGGDVTVAFGPTNLLTFSPFASTSDNGARWTSGVIPFGIASVPDVLIAPAANDGAMSALEHGGAGVQSGTGAQAQWASSYTEAELAGSAAGRSCGVTAITAVAGTGNDQVVGATCARPGVVGIFRAPTGSSGTWEMIGSEPDAKSTHFDVLRLSTNGGRVTALVDGLTGGATGGQASNALYGMWSEEATPGWSTSAPLSLPAHAHIMSSGFGNEGSLFVETKSSRGSLSTSVISAGSGATWESLPRLPAGTASVSMGSPVAALSVGISRLTEWQLEEGSWVKIGAVDVPIQFGSSS